MRNIAIVRKVPFKLAPNRLVWGVILAEREGLSLLFIQRPDEHRSHQIVLAVENKERVFEDTNASRFPLEHDDLLGIGNILNALGDGMSKEEFKRFFNSDDNWMD